MKRLLLAALLAAARWRPARTTAGASTTRPRRSSSPARSSSRATSTRTATCAWRRPGKTWNVVLAPPSRMENRGLQKEWLKPGATATVEGYANRDKPEEMRAERIIINGKTIELR